MFGLCARPSYHGHTYTCDVTVRGPVNPLTGFVVDLAILDRILGTEVRERFDHRNINTDVPEFAEGKLVPSGENLARFICERVQSALAKDTNGAVKVSAVTVAEDDTLRAAFEP